MRSIRSGARSLGAGLAMLAFGAGPAGALNFSFTGNLVADDDVQFFGFSVGGTSTVTLRTYSYAGGTNSAGTAIPAGGFDPILAVFDAAGNLIDQNDDGSSAVVPADPVSGSHFDTHLETTLGAGSYTVAVSQYDNFATGPTLASGFDQQGDPNFTSAAFGCSNGQFCDFDGFNRTSFWAFDILNANAADITLDFDEPVVPDPGGSFQFAFLPIAGNTYADQGALISTDGTELWLLGLFPQNDPSNPFDLYTHTGNQYLFAVGGATIVDFVDPDTGLPFSVDRLSFYLVDCDPTPACGGGAGGQQWSAAVYDLNGDLIREVVGTSDDEIQIAFGPDFGDSPIQRLVFTPSADIEGIDTLSFGSVPEPGSLVLLLLGGGLHALRQRRRRS